MPMSYSRLIAACQMEFKPIHRNCEIRYELLQFMMLQFMKFVKTSVIDIAAHVSGIWNQYGCLNEASLYKKGSLASLLTTINLHHPRHDIRRYSDSVGQNDCPSYPSKHRCLGSCCRFCRHSMFYSLFFTSVLLNLLSTIAHRLVVLLVCSRGTFIAIGHVR